MFCPHKIILNIYDNVWNVNILCVCEWNAVFIKYVINPQIYG